MLRASRSCWRRFRGGCRRISGEGPWAVLVSPYSPSGLVATPNLKPPPSQDAPKPYLTSLHFSSRFLLRLGSLLGSSWLPLGLHLGSLLGSILAQLRPKSLPKRSKNTAKNQDEKKSIQDDLGPILGRSWGHLGPIWGPILGPKGVFSQRFFTVF